MNCWLGGGLNPLLTNAIGFRLVVKDRIFTSENGVSRAFQLSHQADLAATQPHIFKLKKKEDLCANKKLTTETVLVLGILSNPVILPLSVDSFTLTVNQGDRL
jgi:hypothetical protein